MISGKNIVLTGGNSGIGLAMLETFAKNGNNVLAVDIRVNEISKFGENVTAMECDISVPENIDSVFIKANGLFKKIDIMVCNAGYMHFERIDYVDWERTERIFRTNAISPIYTYQRYIEHLDGRDGVFAVTVSAMGRMGMPGFALYSATKFALDGFQQSIRYEKPDNLQVTCLYPVSTDTAFFASPVELEKPYPVQTPEHVAARMIDGIEKGKGCVSPCRRFSAAMFIFKLIPPVRWAYIRNERNKFLRYEERLKKMNKDE